MTCQVEAMSIYLCEEVFCFLKDTFSAYVLRHDFEIQSDYFPERLTPNT